MNKNTIEIIDFASSGNSKSSTALIDGISKLFVYLIHESSLEKTQKKTFLKVIQEKNLPMVEMAKQYAFHLINNFSDEVRQELSAIQNKEIRFENMLDPIPLIPELAPDRIRLAPSSAQARGLELTLEYDNGDKLNWWTSYTLSRITDRIDGADELRNWDQEHSLQAGLAWHLKNWELGFAANIHTGWPTTLATLEEDDDGEPLLVFEPRNEARLNTFASIDFKAARIC